MPSKVLNEQFIKTGLFCPENRHHIEYTSADRSGLYVEVRSTSQGQGTYWFRFKDKDTGKTARVRIGRTTDVGIKDAKERVKILRAKRALGEEISTGAKSSSSLSWAALFRDHYLPYKRSHGKKTIKNDEEMNRRIEQRFGDIPVHKLTAVQIRQFHADLKESGLSPATADHHLKLIRHALNLAVDWDLLKSNPALKVKQFNQTRIINRALDPEELARLMKVLTTDNNRMVCHFIMLLLALGTRKGELLLAEWIHVDLEKRTLFLPGGNAKSGKDRYVFLSDFALDVLDKLGTEGKHTHLFVSSRTGERLSEISSKTWGRLRKKAQLEDCRIHDLRRTHGTILGEANVNAMLIKDALGHASVTMSQIYVAPHDTARLQAANIAGDHLSSALKAATGK
jgi:integrase